METQKPTLGEMDSDEFRQAGYELVDWIAGYLEQPEKHHVVSRVHPGDIARQLPASPPDQPQSMASIIADFEEVIED